MSCYTPLKSVALKFGSEKVSRYTGVSQLQLRVSRYTVQLRSVIENWKSVILEFSGKSKVRRLFVTCCVFTRYFFVALFVVFSWLFRGPLLSRKTLFGPFSLLFRGFFVAPVLGKFYAYSPWNSLLKMGP